MRKTSRRSFLERISAASVFLRLRPAIGAIAADPGHDTLWYRQPASKWEEALPVGNGRLGAMIFGGVAQERLQLNEITVWSGRLEPDADRTESYKSLPAIREMLNEGKYADVVKAMNAERTCQVRSRLLWFVSDAR